MSYQILTAILIQLIELIKRCSLILVIGLETSLHPGYSGKGILGVINQEKNYSAKILLTCCPDDWPKAIADFDQNAKVRQQSSASAVAES